MGRKRKRADRVPQPFKPYKSITAEEKTNGLYEKFYQAQCIVPPADWPAFLGAMRRELPAAWRFVAGPGGDALHQLFTRRYVQTWSDQVTLDDQLVQPPVKLDWFPEEAGVAYQMQLPRKALRRHPHLSALHNFLVTETDLGNVSRQEAVSMVPALLLDVAGSHRVLDMCAAPGSKTAQLVEAQTHAGTSAPTGFVLANDVDPARCHLLVKQALRRSSSPACVVTCHDATQLPNLAASEAGDVVRFDRVLCDVVCSGDGTMRKAPDQWLKWTPAAAMGMHSLQFPIVRRGAQLLADGGLLIYSTCSLNPLEDEAVVARLLNWADGSLELVDVSDRLVGLKRTPGLTTWKVMDKKGNLYDKFDEVPKEKVLGKLTRDLFPPDNAAELNLHRTFRILPHAQDTGGFFVAVLRKVPKRTVTTVVVQPSASGDGVGADEAPQAAAEAERQPKMKKRKKNSYAPEPFVFKHDTDAHWQELKSYYGLSDELRASHLFARSRPADESDASRILYLVNGAVRDLIEHNPHLKVINAGVRAFNRTECKTDECRFRITQQVLPFFLPHISDRKVECADKEDYVKILRSERNIDLCKLSDKFQEVLSEARGGSAIVSHVHEGRPLALCAWKGRTTLAAYAVREVRLHQLRLLGEDTGELERKLEAERKGGKVKDGQSDAGAQGDEGEDEKEKENGEEGDDDQQKDAEEKDDAVPDDDNDDDNSDDTGKMES